MLTATTNLAQFDDDISILFLDFTSPVKRMIERMKERKKE